MMETGPEHRDAKGGTSSGAEADGIVCIKRRRNLNVDLLYQVKKSMCIQSVTHCRHVMYHNFPPPLH